MDDVDRLVARDYEPSDQDVVKARLRTVGVQEHNLSIPGGKCSTPGAGVGPYLTACQGQGRTTGSCTMLAVRGHLWVTSLVAVLLSDEDNVVRQ